MDGFRERDRMNRGSSDRGSSDRYDRYDRYSRSRSSYSMGAPEGLSSDEVAGIVEDSNAKQLDIINDFFEDAKADRLESEKQIISALDGISKDISKEVSAEILSALDERDKEKEQEKAAEAIEPDAEPVAEVDDTPSEADKIRDEILRTVNSNNDLLATFAEEQLPMLVRGNTSTLNQINHTLEGNDDILRQILDNTSTISSEIAGISAGSSSSAASDYYSEPTPVSTGGNDEILSTATNNGALINALRSEVAALQQQLNEIEAGLESHKPVADDNAPLDSEDVLLKSQADEMYKNLEEHVHSECVKVYRNFQKTLEDQNKAVLDGVGKSSGGVRIFALLAFIAAFFNLIITFLSIYEIL